MLGGYTNLYPPLDILSTIQVNRRVLYMCKYHTIVAIDPTGSQELDVVHFIQASGTDDVIYLYVSGDVDIPTLTYHTLPDCECPVDEYGDKDDDCMCGYGETLVNRVMKYYEDLGLDARIINLGSFISSLA